MSLNIKKADGSLQKIAGSTVILDASAAEIRSGSFSVTTGSKGASTSVSVTFATPFPTDDDYIVTFSEPGSMVPRHAMILMSKTANGFMVLASQVTDTSGTATVNYTAARLIALDGYTEVQNKVNNPGTVPTEDSTDLITSGGVYDALQQVATNVVDNVTTLVNDDGKIEVTPVALVDDEFVETNEDDKITLPKPQRTWTGTYAEWQALSAAEKEKYEGGVVNITNDEDAGPTERYSTEEVKTNKVWIDGKPIYRKGFNMNVTMPSSGWTNLVNVSDLNIDTLIKTLPTGHFGGGSPLLNLRDAQGLQVSATGEYLQGYRLINMTTVVRVLVIEYTKTTD